MILRDTLSRPDGRCAIDPGNDMEVPDVICVRDQQALSCARQAVVCRRHLRGEKTVLHREVPHRLDRASGRGAALQGKAGELLQSSSTDQAKMFSVLYC